jgi:hypothetical protein
MLLVAAEEVKRDGGAVTGLFRVIWLSVGGCRCDKQGQQNKRNQLWK